MKKNIKKINILLLVSLLFITITVQAQNSFVLISLNPNQNFVYKQVGTNNYIEFNITHQYPLQTSTNGGIYINSLVPNATTSLNIVNTGTILSTGTNNTSYSIQFGNVINSTFFNSAKGNMLVNGSEYRNFTYYNNSGTVFSGVLEDKASFQYADRAITLLTGNPVFDTFTFTFSYKTNNVDLEGGMVAHVTYDVSDSFTTTYLGQSVTVKNITESYNWFVQNLGFNILDSKGTVIQSVSQELHVANYENIYSFASNIGLPIFISKFNPIPVANNNLFKFAQSNGTALDANTLFFLQSYSWNTSASKSTDFPIYTFIITFIVLAISIRKKKHN